jgi:hypothetical protein
MTEKTDITFSLKSDTCVNIIRDGDVIGQIWSDDCGSVPYPYAGVNVRNAIQICGFDRLSPEWGCGRFGHKDIVATFDSYPSKRMLAIEYKNYVLLLVNTEPDKIVGFDEWCRMKKATRV